MLPEVYAPSPPLSVECTEPSVTAAPPCAPHASNLYIKVSGIMYSCGTLSPVYSKSLS